MTEGHTVTRIRVEPVAAELHLGHLTLACSFEGDAGPACPACLAVRLPADLPEHRWPWVPRIGPGALVVPVPERHDQDVVR